MKKADKKELASDEMLPEYDFSKGVRGKYAARFLKGSNVVVLEPDIAKVFADSDAVNEALRTLVRMGMAKQRQEPDRADRKKKGSFGRESGVVVEPGVGRLGHVKRKLS